jgi:hypothetical protein
MAKKTAAAAAPVAPVVVAPVSSAWNAGFGSDGRPGMELHTVLAAAEGEKPSPYRSVWDAWQKLNIGGSRGRHIKFRAELKRTPDLKKVYIRPDDGKRFSFIAIPAKPKA